MLNLMKNSIYDSSPYFTEEQVQFIRDNYPKMNVEEIAQHIGKSKNSCQSKIWRMGLGKTIKRWKKSDDQFIVDNHKTMKTKEMATYLGCSLSSCQGRINKLNLTRNWAEDENDILILRYPKDGEFVCSELLPGRSPTACQRQANKLGLVREKKEWESDEDSVLIETFSTKGAAGCALLLKHRTKRECSIRAKELRLKSPQQIIQELQRELQEELSEEKEKLIKDQERQSRINYIEKVKKNASKRGSETILSFNLASIPTLSDKAKRCLKKTNVNTVENLLDYLKEHKLTEISKLGEATQAKILSAVLQFSEQGISQLSSETSLEMKEYDPSFLAINVEEIPELSVRARNCFKNKHLNTIQEIIEYLREHKLTDIKNLGVSTQEEILNFFLNPHDYLSQVNKIMDLRKITVEKDTPQYTKFFTDETKNIDTGVEITLEEPSADINAKQALSRITNNNHNSVNILLPHNESFYMEFRKELDDYRKALYVAGTGIGKSYIIVQYLLDTQFSALLVVPTNELRKQWDKLRTKYNLNIDFTTYHALRNMANCKNYDVLILDEAHHVGAKSWGANARRLWEESGCILIGMTATSTRHTDRIKTSDVFWDGRYVMGYSIGQAVTEGILPPFTYVTGMFEITDLIHKYKNRAKGVTRNKKLIDRAIQSLELNFENQYNISLILAKHLPEYPCKGYVFVDKIASIPSAEHFVKTTLHAPVFTLHSKQSYTEKQTNIEAFDKSTNGYIVSVDMLGEGVRFDGANILIMFRRTQSNTVFTQQLGRVLSASQNSPENIVIFDLVANIKNAYPRDSLPFDSSPDDDFGTSGGSGNIPPLKIRTKSQIIINDYIYPLYDVLDELDSYFSETWTEAEKAVISEFYLEKGAKWCSEHLEGRSVRACIQQAETMGIIKFKKWLKIHDDFLIKSYRKYGAKWCAKRLERSVSACNQRASKLGLTKDRTWSDKHIQLMTDHYSEMGPQWCAKQLNRTVGACKEKARELGLTKKRKTA